MKKSFNTANKNNGSKGYWLLSGEGFLGESGETRSLPPAEYSKLIKSCGNSGIPCIISEFETKQKEKIAKSALKSLLPKDEADERDCILEVRAGYWMGKKASLLQYDEILTEEGMKSLISEESRKLSAAISGVGVYGKLKCESGIHRVQAVPLTEKSGRVHTSAVSVAILPQADEVDVRLRNEDLRMILIDLEVLVNKAKALKVLCAKLYGNERSRIHLSRSKLRSEQAG
ncbi:hypothetical protein CUMW_271850 [Citrus unshiu]|uniref:Peptide chain release factor domain-containing protein n=1 Tax=Citrus unshiu TaxID=55188 RepID=A0A2H5QXU2_CITUN|nr:hypothetical protein CUMW_271850 [Citrus unshiu]